MESFSKLTDENKKQCIDYTKKLLEVQNMDTKLDKKYTESEKIVPITKELDMDYTVINAAHALDNATQEDIQHDDDIMDNDDEWN